MGVVNQAIPHQPVTSQQATEPWLAMKNAPYVLCWNNYNHQSDKHIDMV